MPRNDNRNSFLVEELVEFDLCGYDQGMSKIAGTGTIRSDAPAFLELNVAAETTNEVQCAFVDKAGFKMIGAGTGRQPLDHRPPDGRVVRKRRI